MTLLVLLIASYAVLYIPELKQFQNYQWITDGYQFWTGKLSKWNKSDKFWESIVFLLPIVFVALFVEYALLSQSLLGLFLWNLLILLLVLTPIPSEEQVIEYYQDIFVTEPEVSSGDQDDESISKSDRPEYSEDDEIKKLWLPVLQGWFGVVFYLVIIGPLGALLYRVIEVLSKEDKNTFHKVHQFANWPVAQLLALGMAIVDNFVPIYAQWKQQKCPKTGERFDLDCHFLSQVMLTTVDDSMKLAHELGQDLYLDNKPLARIVIIFRLFRKVQWVWFTAIGILILAGLMS